MKDNKKSIKTKVIFIKDYCDIELACSYIEKKYEVIVNVSSSRNQERYIDFISGFTYAHNGIKQKLEDGIYSFKIY